MNILIGNTGLVGTTLQEKIKFDFLFNSKNINKFVDYDFNGCNLYLTCLPATKWIVNQNITKDITNINNLIEIISNNKYKNIILISTIDVYSDSPLGVDEDYYPNMSDLNYGSNRLIFEKLIKHFIKYDNLKIFRLPALFNKHIKKNVIYDLINNNNVDQININSTYQWYNLDNIVSDINSMIDNENNVFNLFTEPLNTIEIVNLFPNYFDKVKNNQNKIIYDYKTKFNKTGYIKSKEEILKEIILFINGTISK